MSLNWCNNSVGLPDDQPTYYSGSQTTIEKALLLHCSVHTPPRASRCHLVQGKYRRDEAYKGGGGSSVAEGAGDN